MKKQTDKIETPTRQAFREVEFKDDFEDKLGRFGMDIPETAIDRGGYRTVRRAK